MNYIRSPIRGVAGSPLNPNNGVGPLVDLNFLQSTYIVRASAFNSTAIPALTVTRASVGYAETAAGVLVPFASGEARITDKGCLVEEARTNLAIQSQTFSGWVGGAAAPVANATIAPDGTATGAKLRQAAANVYQSLYAQPAATASTAYTRTVYLKAAELSWVYLQQYDGINNKGAYFNVSTGAIGTIDAGVTASITAVSNGWYRCSVTFTTQAAATYERIQIALVTANGASPSYLGDGTSGVYAWGAQLETGSFASSYIPTTTAAATRAADQITVSSVAVPLTNFTLYAEVALDSLAGGGYQGVAALDDGTSANQVYLFKTAGNNRARGGVDIASAGVFDTASSPSTLPVLAVGVSKLAFIRAGGSVRVEANGILYPDTTQAALPALSRLNVGRFNGNSFPTNGYVRRITLMDRAVGGLTA